MSISMGIITCVTNANGYGPGHTALWIEGTCYSFERMGSQNGWLVTPVSTYVALPLNRGRPLIYYRLNARVNPTEVQRYLDNDSTGWSVYGPNVCSQKASEALNRGAIGGFDPKGYDTPYGVYWHAWNRNFVAEWWAVWKDPSAQSDAARQRIYDKLWDDYQIGADELYTG